MDPRITDKLLMGLGRRQVPAVDNYPSDVITEETAKAFANQKQAEEAQDRLNLAKLGLAYQTGLGERRLAQQASQFEKGLEFSKRKFGETLGFNKYKFDTDMALAQDEAQKNRRLANTATLISLGGLGVEGLRTYQNAKRAEEISKKYDEMISFYKNQKTPTGKFYADWIKMLRID